MTLLVLDQRIISYCYCLRRRLLSTLSSSFFLFHFCLPLYTIFKFFFLCLFVIPWVGYWKFMHTIGGSALMVPQIHIKWIILYKNHAFIMFRVSSHIYMLTCKRRSPVWWLFSSTSVVNRSLVSVDNLWFVIVITFLLRATCYNFFHTSWWKFFSEFKGICLDFRMDFFCCFGLLFYPFKWRWIIRTRFGFNRFCQIK